MNTTNPAPAMIVNKQQGVVANVDKSKTPRERYVVGTSGCYFEVADYMKGKLDASLVKKMFLNPNTSIEETRGKSLKVMFTAENEVKYLGFITAGDAMLSLNKTHIEAITQHTTEEEIYKAVNVDDLVSMF